MFLRIDTRISGEPMWHCGAVVRCISLLASPCKAPNHPRTTGCHDRRREQGWKKDDPTYHRPIITNPWAIEEPRRKSDPDKGRQEIRQARAANPQECTSAKPHLPAANKQPVLNSRGGEKYGCTEICNERC